jgi:hypothetical protein
LPASFTNQSSALNDLVSGSGRENLKEVSESGFAHNGVVKLGESQLATALPCISGSITISQKEMIP